LFELHAGMPPVGADASRLAAAAEQLVDERRLQWKDWTRFSSRQGREMTLGGVIGEWTLRGDLQELLPWFWLGQWLHVGKETTMGLNAGATALHNGCPDEEGITTYPSTREWRRQSSLNGCPDEEGIRTAAGWFSC
jgi:hypothetical protein